MIATHLRNRQLPWICICALVAVACGALIGSLRPSQTNLLILALGVTVALPLALRIAHGEFDVFEPIVFFALAWAGMFIARPIAMLATNNFLAPQAGYAEVSSTFDQMLLLALLGAFAFIVGYEIPVGRDLAARLRPSIEFDTRLATRLTLFVAFIGIGAYGTFLILAGGLPALLLLLQGRSRELIGLVDASSKYLYVAPQLLVSLPLVLLEIQRRTGQRRYWLLAGLIASMLAIIAIPTGSRIALLPLAGGLTVYYFVARGRRPRVLVALLVLYLAVALSTVVGSSRSAGSEARSSLGDTFRQQLLNPSKAFAPLLTGPDAEMAADLAAALVVVPRDIGHTFGGATVGDVLTRPIPRSLWANKPTPPRERVIAEIAPYRYRVGLSNPEFSTLFVFYIDWGTIGTMLMAAWGIVFRFAYEALRLHSAAAIVRVGFALCIPFVIVAMRDSPVDTLQRASFMILPALVILHLAHVFRPRNPSSATSTAP